MILFFFFLIRLTISRIENSKSKTHSLKKTRIRNSQNHVLIRIHSKIISTNMITCLQNKILKRNIFSSLEKNERKDVRKIFVLHVINQIIKSEIVALRKK